MQDPKLKIKKPVEFNDNDGERDPFSYVIDDDSLTALQMAWATGRPLLIRGEPGIGKTQLARAAAKGLGVPIYEAIIVARTEAEHLLFEFDYVRRLADAQAPKDNANAVSPRTSSNYLLPREVWWALAPQHAYDTALSGIEQVTVGAKETLYKQELNPKQGCVLLIDEIDKADSEVPNSLLDVLDRKRFFVPMLGEWIQAAADRPVLVILTTNGERDLPNAFLRRCVIHTMKLGNDPRGDLTLRARAHFTEVEISVDVLNEAIRQILEDREDKANSGYKTGVSELIDLLSALKKLSEGIEPSLGREARQVALLQDIGKFVRGKGSFNESV
jgi:MoxR-like ATPase